jgi:Ca2+-binding RTX toxin-like protein
MPGLFVSTSTDFRGRTLTSISDIVVTAPGVIATFNASQFGGSGISNAVNLWSGGFGGEQIIVIMATSGTFSAAQWDVGNWQTGAAPFRFQGSSGNDTITGTSKADLFIGGNGSDNLRGGGGADTFRYELSTHLGADESINGGSGTDVIEVTHGGTFNAINVDITSVETYRFLAQTSATAVFSDVQLNAAAIRRVESVQGISNFVEVRGSDIDMTGVVFAGWEPRDIIRLRGTAGADTIVGTEFRDFIRGGAGADQLVGGDDIDDFEYFALGDFVVGETVDGGAGDGDRLFLGAAGVHRIDLLTLTDVETIQFGGNAPAAGTAFVLSSQIGASAPAGHRISVISGTSDYANELIVSGPNTNLTGVVFGNYGLDGDTVRLLGTAGGDILIGSTIDDIFVGDAGADSYNGAGGSDTVSYSGSASAVTVNLATGLGSGGFAAGDALAAIENIIGSSGADTLTGNAQNNTIRGGAGADTLTGGGGVDTLSYEGSASQVLINLGNGQAQGGDAQGDVFSNFRNLMGSDHADGLFGDGLENVIRGGRGADSLFGGLNNDTFVFRQGEADGDTLIDFAGNGVAAGDQLLIEGYGAGTTLVQIDATHWEIRSNNSPTETLTLSNGAPIHASDFIILF